jgi:hypothetical protein
MNQTRFIFTDEADAIAYWAGREFKTFAVDVRTGARRRSATARTLYVRARTPERAEACAQQEDWQKKPGTKYVARLAGPRELGCVPTPGAPVTGPARAVATSLREKIGLGAAPARGPGVGHGRGAAAAAIARGKPSTKGA